MRSHYIIVTTLGNSYICHILAHSNVKSSIPSLRTDPFEFPECALALHLATEDNSFVQESKEVVCPRVERKSFLLFYWQTDKNHVSQVYASVASHFFSK